MRVCLLNHDLREDTGAGRFGLALMSHLRAADPAIEPVVLTSVGSGHPGELAILRPRWFELLAALPQIRSELRRADLVHALDGWPYGVVAALASLGLEKPLLITAIGTGAIQPLHRPLRALLARWAYRRAERVVAISRYTRREVLKKVPDLEIEVINHAVDAAEFQGDALGALAAEERNEVLGLKPYLLSVGAPKPRKGFADLLRAFALIRPRFPNLRYVVVGGGSAEIRALAEGLGIAHHVTFLSRIPRARLVALYRQAELFWLLPVDDHKDVEGFGFAFLEAAAAGIPVIGTHDSGAEDAVAEGENGSLVPPRDPRAAAEAVIRILSSSSLREQYAAGSRAFAAGMNWNRMAEQYLAIYRLLLARRV